MEKNDLMERLKLLGEVLKNLGGSIEGRKKMQKLFFLLQECKIIPDIYEFEWSYYGVYSDALAGDVQQGIGFGLLSEEKDESHLYPTYKIKLKDEDEWDLRDLPTKKKELIEDLSRADTPLLEVASSIVYFKKEDYKDVRIKELLGIYKKHLEDYFDRGFELAKKFDCS